MVFQVTVRNQGHSFLSKFLITAVPWSVFSTNSEILPEVLRDIAKCYSALFEEGIEINGERFNFAMIGCKGDAEFHVDAGQFLRSFQIVGTVSDHEMCPYCHATTSNFGDVSDSPCWLDSVTCLELALV